ncbi:unnamed protein product [Diamesa serratosioi]
MVAPEFQAVVLAAGHGTRFPDLVGNRPKCLLPIGPFPLIYYPLQLLHKYGFHDAIIIVLENQKNEVQQKIDRSPNKLKLEYLTISTDQDFGSADSLRLISEKIKTDVLLISCDILTDVDFYPLLNMFRKNDASIVSLFINNASENGIIIPGPKYKHKHEKDLVGINPLNDRLHFLASTSDFEEQVLLPGHLIRSNGKINIHSGLVDAHIYLVRKWVVEFLARNDKFSTIKGELLPCIIKKQMSRPFVGDADKSEYNLNTKECDVFEHIRTDELDLKIIESNMNNIKKSYSSEMIKCFSYIAPKTTVGIRVNTILGFCIANKKIFSIWDKVSGGAPLISVNSIIKSKQLSDSAVAENTQISDKTSIKSTVFGNNCVIETKTRISDSYILNNVTIEEDVFIENSIICDRAIVKKGSVLKNCFVGCNFVVEEFSTKENALLTGEGFVIE